MIVCSYYAGANNSFFQGLTADGALAALYEVTRRCYKVTNSALYGFRVVAFVHDELVLEGPATKCSEAATELQHAMEKAMGVYTPDCLTPAEPIVSSIWSKDAKQVWENGKLIPWRV